jgi:hypothetical protein
MPRLSLYRPEKGNDYKFIDKTVYEMFQVGGTDIFVHKYVGPIDPANPNTATTVSTIQDILFLENRDRKYDSTVYIMRGIYSIQDIDFNLSQFGLFLQNDTVFMSVHMNNSVETLGRKPVAGDVFELPHLKDDFALNDFAISLKRFYVVEEVSRGSEGFSVTWYPHLFRLKLKPIVDSQEFKDILDMPQNTDSYAGDYDNSTTYYPGQVVKYNGQLYNVTAEVTNINPPNDLYYTLADSNDTLRALMSTYDKELAIGEAIVAEAELNAPQSGYSTRNYYTLQVDENGISSVKTVASDTTVDSAGTTDQSSQTPTKSGYQGYLVGGDFPPNGSPYGFGIQFPEGAAEGDYFLRTDYLPSRMFRFNGARWVKFEDNVRMTMTNTDNREKLKTRFTNNTAVTNIDLLYTDTFIVVSPMIFRVSDLSASLDLTNSKVVTRIPYVNTYGVETFVNDQIITVADVRNEDGFLAFITANPLKISDTLRWCIYRSSIPQRVALSKALKPKADF